MPRIYKTYFKSERYGHLYKVNRLTPQVLFTLYKRLYLSFVRRGSFNFSILKQLSNVNLSIISHSRQQMSSKLKNEVLLFFNDSFYFSNQFKAYQYLEEHCISNFENNFNTFVNLLKNINNESFPIVKHELTLLKLKLEQDTKLFKVSLDTVECQYLRSTTKNPVSRSSLLLVYTTFSRIIESQRQIIQFVEYYEWLPLYNLNFFLGVDGISMFFIILTTLLISICILVSWNNIKKIDFNYMHF